MKLESIKGNHLHRGSHISRLPGELTKTDFVSDSVGLWWAPNTFLSSSQVRQYYRSRAHTLRTANVHQDKDCDSLVWGGVQRGFYYICIILFLSQKLEWVCSSVVKCCLACLRSKMLLGSQCQDRKKIGTKLTKPNGCSWFYFFLLKHFIKEKRSCPLCTEWVGEKEEGEDHTKQVAEVQVRDAEAVPGWRPQGRTIMNRFERFGWQN